MRSSRYARTSPVWRANNGPAFCVDCCAPTRAWHCSFSGLRRISETLRGQLELYQRELQYVRPEADGDYLRNVMHIPPGPLYGRLLAAVRDARLDGEVGSIREERALVERLLEEELERGPVS